MSGEDASGETAGGERWRGNWDGQPASRWEDAFLTGNGYHGAMVHGEVADERIVLNHHLLVRPNGAESCRAPELAAQLPQLRADVLAGRAAAAVARTLPGTPLQWVRPFHPAYALRVRRPGSHPPTTAYRREVDYRTGVVTVRWTEAGGRWRAETFVSRADDLVVHRLTAPPGAELDAEVWHDTALPGAPDSLRVSHVGGTGGATALLHTGVYYHPGSADGYAGWTRLLATGGHLTPAGHAVRVTGCQSLTLLSRLSPGSASTTPPATDADYESLFARHLPAHRVPYDRVTLELAVPEAERALPVDALLAEPRLHRGALLERLFDAGRYHLLSSAGQLPPRLTGLWTGDWDTAWAGALTCDANLNLQLASAAVGALPEVSLAHARFVTDRLPDWRSNAQRIFGTRGVVAPAHTDGLSGHSYHYSAEYPLHLWTAGAHWLLLPLVDHVLTTGDQEFRRRVLDPLLDEVADFYQDFLIPDPASSALMLVPSYSPENTPQGADGPISVNAVMDLAAARHALTVTGRTALADRLPRYRINEDGALAEWVWPSAGDRYDHRHLSHLYPVWPLDEINPVDTPELARAAHRALALRGAENDSAHGYLHAALVAARLGDAERVEQALSAVLDGGFFHRSLMSSHYPDRDVYNADAAHTLPAVLIEALLHSTPHRTQPLPAAPKSLPAGTLRGVRTRHGTTVAELTWRDGQVITLHEGKSPCSEPPAPSW